MFCTDVLRAWAECSLKDFSQAWGGGEGFRYNGREMALIHHTELGSLVVRVSSLGGCMEKCTQGAQSDRIVWGLSTSVHTCPLLPFTSSKSIQPTFSPATYQCINPHPSLCCRWVCFVDPSVTAVSEGRLVERCRGEEGCLAELPPPPRGRQWRINKTRSKAAGVDSSYQLSGVSWVSMSTLQMGHFLLVASHWSTHAWWKRCMQGNLLQTQKRHGQDLKIDVGFSFKKMFCHI